MSEYFPDKWVGVKISGKDIKPIYKIFASWYGGYGGSDSWKLNSGVTKIEEDGQCYLFHGSSGSVYSCHKSNYGSHLYGRGILSNLIQKAKDSGYDIEVLPEETNWMELEYE